MAETVVDTLVRSGLTGPDAERLAARLAADADDPAGRLLDATGPARHLLAAALAASRDPRLLPTALPLLLAAVRRAEPSLPPSVRGILRHLDGLVAWRLGHDVPAATRAFGDSLRHLEAAGGTPEALAYRPRVHDTLGQMLHHQGLLEDARPELEQSLREKEACGDRAGTALTLGNLGRLCMELGDFEAAAGYLQRDLAFVREDGGGDPRLEAMLESQVGACFMEIGSTSEARLHLEAGHRLAGRAEDAVGQAFAEVGLGRLALREGHADVAARHVEAAQERIPALPAALRHDVEAATLQLAAEVDLLGGRLDASLERFDAASRSSRHAGRLSPIERAGLMEAWSRAFERAGRPREAAERLRQALLALDASSAEELRGQMDRRLKALDEPIWMLHSAGRFVGHAQIERLLSQAGKGGFRGRTTDVTVLFSDIRNFTSVTEGMDAEVLIRILNRYLAHMTRCVEHFDGMVDKFIGDAVMAVFSLPDPRPDDADRAIASALYMQSELARMNRGLEDPLPRLQAGVGLHTGSVVAGLIGSPRKRSYTVIGDAVNTASRLEGMTKQLGVPVLVSAEVVRQLADPDRFLLVPFGRFRPKGRRAAVEVSEVVGERASLEDVAAEEQRAREARDAWALFEERRFSAAHAAFVALAASREGRSAQRGYRLIASRAAAFADEPPASDWDGSVDLTEK